MRVELFAKDATSLAASARQLVGFGATGLNVPQKSKAEPPLLALHALKAVLPQASMCNVVPHYSLKFSGAGSAGKSLQAFEEFCTEAHALQVRELLLVSGSGSRQFDSLACLRAMRLPTECAPGIGVAFNPYFPEAASRERERARLRDKVETGRVSSVWLQIGSDLDLLREGLSFVRSLSVARPLNLHGSVFVPSRRLLAQMKSRPWNGVFLSDEYLSGVTAAAAITRSVVAEYNKCGVEVLVETALRTEDEWAHAAALLCPELSSATTTMPPAAESSVAVVDGTPSATDALADATVEPLASNAGGADPAAARPSKRARSSTAHTPRSATAASAAAADADDDVVLESFEAIPDGAQKAGSAASWDEAVGAAIPPAIVWYRTFDLRTADHAPLLAAVERRGAVIPAFVWPERRGRYAIGGAAQAWLLSSLEHLDKDLSELGSGLVLRGAPPTDALPGGEAPAAILARVDALDLAMAEARDTAAALCHLAAESGATHVYWHKSYEPEGQLVEALVASALREQMGYVECVAQGLAGHLLCKLLQPTLADSTCARTLTGLGASRLSQRMPSFAPQMSRAWW